MLYARILIIISVVFIILLPGCKKETASESTQPLPPTQQAKPLEQTQPVKAQEALSPLPPEFARMTGFQPWFGDLAEMIQRRVIRVLVSYNKTTYFLDGVTPHGIAYDAMKEFETVLNKKLKLGKLGVHVLFLPVSRDQMIKMMPEGKGDIAIAGITVTKELQQIVDFTDPVVKNSSEIIVTGPGAPNIASVTDLSGQEIFLREGSTKHHSLIILNEEFRKQGKKEVVFRFAPPNFEDEDILELTNAGIVKIAVVDLLTGEFWKQILPDITLHPDVAVRTGADIAWAVRKNTPQLKSELNEFIKTHAAGTTFGNILLKKYLKNVQYVKNSTSEAELKKYATLKTIFEKYGKEYAVDWVLMAAQGYQESRLDQSVKSQVGAIGVMQVMPSTGEELKVGDIHQIENNIHAGIKYMRFMINQYYKDEPIDLVNKMLFTFASYNAGPARIRGLRKEAAARGLNANVWFNNVEYVAAEKIGQETVTYVSNIFKYYIAYKLVREQNLEREQVMKRLEKN